MCCGVAAKFQGISKTKFVKWSLAFAKLVRKVGEVAISQARRFSNRAPWHVFSLKATLCAQFAFPLQDLPVE